jgi:hypothetical protein
VSQNLHNFNWKAPTQIRLRSLRLERSNIHTESLQKLLQLCPVLEILKYEHDEVDQPLNEWFAPEEFGSSIAHLKPCLRELVLYRPMKNFPKKVCSREETTTIGSLFEFEKLKSLSITAHLLLGARKSPEASVIYQTAPRWNTPPPSQRLTQCLPRSLEYLCLKECGDIRDDIFEFVEHATILTPNLKTLVLQHEDFKGRDDLGHLPLNQQGDLLFLRNWREVKRLKENCAAKGIELDVLYN